MVHIPMYELFSLTFRREKHKKRKMRFLHLITKNMKRIKIKNIKNNNTKKSFYPSGTGLAWRGNYLNEVEL